MTAPATDCAALIRRSQDDVVALWKALRAAQAAQGLSMVEIARRTELPLRDLHDWLERGDLERFDLCAASRVAVALGLTLGAVMSNATSTTAAALSALHGLPVERSGDMPVSPRFLRWVYLIDGGRAVVYPLADGAAEWTCCGGVGAEPAESVEAAVAAACAEVRAMKGQP